MDVGLSNWAWILGVGGPGLIMTSDMTEKRETDRNRQLPRVFREGCRRAARSYCKGEGRTLGEGCLCRRQLQRPVSSLLICGAMMARHCVPSLSVSGGSAFEAACPAYLSFSALTTGSVIEDGVSLPWWIVFVATTPSPARLGSSVLRFFSYTG